MVNSEERGRHYFPKSFHQRIFSFPPRASGGAYAVWNTLIYAFVGIKGNTQALEQNRYEFESQSHYLLFSQIA